MNATDPLENHKKNLFSFYTACKIYDSTTEQSDQSDVNFQNPELCENDPNFLPFLNFRKDSEQVNNLFCDRDKKITQTNNFITEINCDQIIKSRTIEYNNEESLAKYESNSKKAYSGQMFDHRTSEEESDTPNNNNVNCVDVENNKKNDSEKDDSSSNKYSGGRNKIEIDAAKTLVYRAKTSKSLMLQSIYTEISKVGNSISEDMDDSSPFYICEHCNKRFNSKRRTRKHLTKCFHREEATNVPVPRTWKRSTKHDKTCKLCGHVARKPCELKLHMTAKHSSERPFSCKECGIGFASKSKLNRHVKNQVHAKGKFYCKLCKIYFSVKRNFERHKQEHSLPLTVVKPFVCRVCDRRFHRLDILKKHSLSHMRKDNVPLNLSADNH